MTSLTYQKNQGISLGLNDYNFKYLFLGHNALINKLLRINVQDASMLLDNAVHDRLGEHRLIDLIMPILPIPDKINHNILMER